MNFDKFTNRVQQILNASHGLAIKNDHANLDIASGQLHEIF